MNSEPHQNALESDQIIQNHPFWERVRGHFLTIAAVEYNKIVFDDNCFEGFDMSAAPVLHSSEKLWTMWRELCAAYKSATARFEKSGDPDSNFLTFCRNRVDVYYLRCWLNVKPHLLVSVNGKLQSNLGLSSHLLVKVIRDACETLKTVREADLGGEVEDTVRGELATYTKRLRRIQEEETSQV
eukprot:jgi/Phyca11/563596/estExt2_Genewise1.C_PHYCAscaffold_120592